MEKLMSEAYRVMTIGMLIDHIEDGIKAQDLEPIMLTIDEVYEMFTDSNLDVTVDGNHLGTMVGLQWALEMMRESQDVVWKIAYDHDFGRDEWINAIKHIEARLQKEDDPCAWALLVTD
jgi:hypothetical protein